GLRPATDDSEGAIQVGEGEPVPGHFHLAHYLPRPVDEALDRADGPFGLFASRHTRDAVDGRRRESSSGVVERRPFSPFAVLEHLDGRLVGVEGRESASDGVHPVAHRGGGQMLPWLRQFGADSPLDRTGFEDLGRGQLLVVGSHASDGHQAVSDGYQAHRSPGCDERRFGTPLLLARSETPHLGSWRISEVGLLESTDEVHAVSEHRHPGVVHSGGQRRARLPRVGGRVVEVGVVVESVSPVHPPATTMRPSQSALAISSRAIGKGAARFARTVVGGVVAGAVVSTLVVGWGTGAVLDTEPLGAHAASKAAVAWRDEKSRRGPWAEEGQANTTLLLSSVDEETIRSFTSGPGQSVRPRVSQRSGGVGSCCLVLPSRLRNAPERWTS